MCINNHQSRVWSACCEGPGNLAQSPRGTGRVGIETMAARGARNDGEGAEEGIAPGAAEAEIVKGSAEGSVFCVCMLATNEFDETRDLGDVGQRGTILAAGGRGKRQLESRSSGTV